MPIYKCKNGHRSTIQLPKCLACGQTIFEDLQGNSTETLASADGNKTRNFQWNRRHYKLAIVSSAFLAFLLVSGLILNTIGLHKNVGTSSSIYPNETESIVYPSTKSSSSVQQSKKTIPFEKLIGPFLIARVISADTYDVIDSSQNIKRIRLIGIDSPSEKQDKSGQECGGTTATQKANFIFSYPNQEIMLEADLFWPAKDELGNELFYIWLGDDLLTEKLLSSGDAVEFAKYGPYKHQATHLAAQKGAKGTSSSGNPLGLWVDCPSEDGITFGLGVQEEDWDLPILPFILGAEEKEFECHPSYLGTCLNPNSGDYNCGSNPILVVGTDVFRLDGDNDGIACEN